MARQDLEIRARGAHGNLESIDLAGHLGFQDVAVLTVLGLHQQCAGARRDQERDGSEDQI